MAAVLWLLTPASATLEVEIAATGPTFAFPDDVLHQVNISWRVAAADAVAKGLNAVTIVPLFLDTECTAAGGLLTLSPVVDRPHIVGLLGDWCSSTSATMAYMSQLFNIPQVSYGAESASFADKTQFPLFSRTVPSLTVNSRYHAAILKQLNYKTVAVISSSDDFGSSSFTEFQAACDQTGIAIVASQSIQATVTTSTPDVVAAVDAIKLSGASVFVLYAPNAQMCYALMEAAAKAGITGVNFFWIVTQICHSGLSVSVPAVVQNALIGSWSTNYDVTTTPMYSSFVQKYLDADDSGDPFPGVWPMFAYDSWMTYYYTMNRLITNGKTFTDLRNGTYLHQELMKTSFQGATGFVSFDLVTGDREGVSSIVQNAAPNSSSSGTVVIRQIGNVSSSSSGDVSLQLALSQVYWPGDGVTIPTGRSTTNNDNNESRVIEITIPVVVGSIFLGIVATVIYIFMYRRALARREKEQLEFAPKENPVTIVFTDIQNSSIMWRANPIAMMKGIEVHNAVIRRCIRRHKGYEVKTIGDSFMVAFKDPMNAVHFSLEMQSRLYEAKWPPALLKLDDASVEKNFNRGFRVRASIHVGDDCRVEFSEDKKSYDYHGDLVNLCARIESKTPGGLVYCSRQVLELVEPQITHDLACSTDDWRVIESLTVPNAATNRMSVLPRSSYSPGSSPPACPPECAYFREAGLYELKGFAGQFPLYQLTSGRFRDRVSRLQDPRTAWHEDQTFLGDETDIKSDRKEPSPSVFEVLKIVQEQAPKARGDGTWVRVFQCLTALSQERVPTSMIPVEVTEFV